jgi:hypothetical protein
MWETGVIRRFVVEMREIELWLRPKVERLFQVAQLDTHYQPAIPKDDIGVRTIDSHPHLVDLTARHYNLRPVFEGIEFLQNKMVVVAA